MTSRRSLPTSVHPLIEAFQHVAVAILLRSDVIQGGKLKRDHPILVGQRQVVGLEDRALQDGLAADGHRFVRQEEIR